MDLLGQRAILIGLLAVRGKLDHRHAAVLGMLDHVGPGNEVDHRRAQTLGQLFCQLQLLVGLALVADEPAQAHAAGMGVFQDALGDVVGGVHGHHLAGHDDVDLLRLVLADGHGEATADHVAQHIVGDIVHAVVGAVFLQEVDGGDDAAAGTTHAGLGATGLHAPNILVADLEHILDFQVLDTAGLGGQ